MSHANFESDHSSHEKCFNCEECGALICGCLSVCDVCSDRLDREAEAEGQRWHDEREAAAHLNGGWA